VPPRKMPMSIHRGHKRESTAALAQVHSTPNKRQFRCGAEHARHVPEQIGSRHSSKVSPFFVGAEQRDHMGKHNQAPKQVLGVVTLHAICEE
jgi:hypothetical protein